MRSTISSTCLTRTLESPSSLAVSIRDGSRPLIRYGAIISLHEKQSFSTLWRQLAGWISQIPLRVFCSFHRAHVNKKLANPSRPRFDAVRPAVYRSGQGTSGRMESTRTVLWVSLPGPLAVEPSRLATGTGRPKSDIVNELVNSYLWGAWLRRVRRQLIRQAKRTGVRAEADLFRAV